VAVDTVAVEAGGALAPCSIAVPATVPVRVARRHQRVAAGRRAWKTAAVPGWREFDEAGAVIPPHHAAVCIGYLYG
jgi:hypothetical protein